MNSKPTLSVHAAVELQEGWRYPVIGGSLITFLGLAAISLPSLTTFTFSILLGTLLFLGGLVHVANAVPASDWESSLW